MTTGRSKNWSDLIRNFGGSTALSERVACPMSTTVKFVLALEPGDDGSIRSSLKLLSPEDASALRSLPSGGLTQVPHALFVETLRREAYTMAISLLSKGRPVEELTVKELDESVRAHLLKMMELFSQAACEGALREVRSMG